MVSSQTKCEILRQRRDKVAGFAFGRRGAVRDALARPDHTPNLSAARALALAASSSRLFGGAVVFKQSRSRVEAAATSSIAARKATSFDCDGLLKPLILRTN